MAVAVSKVKGSHVAALCAHAIATITQLSFSFWHWGGAAAGALKAIDLSVMWPKENAENGLVRIFESQHNNLLVTWTNMTRNTDPGKFFLSSFLFYSNCSIWFDLIRCFYVTSTPWRQAWVHTQQRRRVLTTETRNSKQKNGTVPQGKRVQETS